VRPSEREQAAGSKPNVAMTTRGQPDAANFVGSDKYVKAINTVAGETYPANYTQGITITTAGIAGLRTARTRPNKRLSFSTCAVHRRWAALL